MTSFGIRFMPRHSARTLLSVLLLTWGTLAMSCSAEVAPEFLTLSITSDAPKSGTLDTLRFLFTDGETTWPSDPSSAEGNKELSSTSDPVAEPVIVQIDYQALTTFSSDTVTLQVAGLSEGAIRTSYEGAVTLTDRQIIEIRLQQLEDNCDTDGDGFLDCTISGCCSEEDMALSDCEPDDPDANPFGTEVACEPCSDTVDNDCQGGDQPCIDTDEDGVPDCEETAESSGCPPGAENDADIYPSRPELCDGKDNDCNGLSDETFLLTTVKGTPGVGEPCGGGECADGEVICVDLTRVECSEVGAAIDDCGESETGNGKDEDCDGLTDEGCDESDLDGDGYSDDDCDPEDAAIYPGAAEGCCLLDLADGEAVGQDCAIDPSANQPCPSPLKCVSTGEAEQCVIKRCDSNCDGAAALCSATDEDGDGHVPPNDCDDSDPMVYPSAPERCGDGVDQSCSGADLSCDGVVDGDGDGWSPPIDCVDDDDDINPSEAELCDGLDNDCDDVIDEGNPETNNTAPCGTGEGECIQGQTICVNGGGITGEVACIGDKGPETDICNGLDDDCDGTTDEDFSAGGVASLNDLDGTPGLTLGDSCGAGACAGGTVVCGPGSSTLLCPTHAEASPDVCNGIDDDCDGKIDEDFVAGGTVSIANTDGNGALVKGDSCGMGACQSGSVICTPDGKGIFCDTAANASPDLCNGDDDDCDGTTDEDFISGGTVSYTTTDGVAGRVKGDACGTGTCGIGQVICASNGLTLMCDNAAPGPDVCDELDNDCDGTTDEAFIAGGVETYTDLDGAAGKVKGDSCGTGQCAGSGLVVCTKGGEALTCSALDQVSPDVCDGADNDCDGATDEDFIAGGTVSYTDLDGTAGKVKGDSCGTGACASGTVVCHGAGDVLTCDTAMQAGLEVCDGADNDCDGDLDETFTDGTVTYTDADGTDGKVKGDSCGTGACGTATVICDPNNSDLLTCGTTKTASPDVCDDIDNDCDGKTDEAFMADGTVTYTDGDGTAGKVKGDSCGTGACASGTVVCHAGGDALTCDTATSATPDVCDDADNDCDGKVDEAFMADGTVTYTDGDGTAGKVKGDSCGSGACADGTVVCHAGGDALTCNTATNATPDVCDDADNDCDGKVDEAFIAAGSVTFVDSDGTADLVKGDACGTGSCGDGQVVCGADGDALTCSNTLGSIERCDGLDNDCDGETDEDFASGGTITVADVDGSGSLSLGDSCGGIGDCGAAVVVCSADGSTMGCESATAASADLCDGDDNDCDGAIDEDFVTLTTSDLDGTTGLQLGDDCGTGACDGLGVGIIQCSADGSGIECSTDGNASADICDGVDNDCDGTIDEDFIEGGTVTAPNVDGSGALVKGATCGKIGACGAGTIVCDGASALVCSTASSASADICDGVDNDCDGTIDEDFIAGGTVTATDVDGSGALAKDAPCGGIGSCATGTVICDGASALVCSTTASASTDICDGDDNDCDGTIDEDFIAGGTVTATDVDGSGALAKDAPCGGIGSCASGTVVCDGVSALVCSTTASASADICDGSDNDCDGTIDEDFIAGGTVTATDVDGSGALA
ncbi:MAG: MopE-related protein, partial [Myxococcota bacterium]